MKVWAAVGAIVVVVAAIGTVLVRGRRSHSLLPPVSEQWLAQHKGQRTQ
jgi:hypothetical protein